MAMTVEGVEELTLEEARRVLGTTSDRETVNAALREVVRRKLVDQFFTYMGSLDPEKLDEARTAAWR